MDPKWWQRIIPKIQVNDDGCWLWTGKLNDGGYAQFADRAGHRVRAHRLIYEAIEGPIPEGFDLDHLCRVRHCVNPKHLEPVTRQENLRRGAGWNSGAWEHCIRGHAWTDENTSIRANGTKVCKKCAVIRQRKYDAERKQRDRDGRLQ